MRAPPVARKYNTQNLQEISLILKDLEHFIFFGTLLGYTRERKIIQNDDDIDIYINIKEYSKFEKIIAENKLNYTVNKKKSQYLLQLCRSFGKIKTYVDFYFYENNSDFSYIIERWNFKGELNNKKSFLHIPKDIIYPIQVSEIENFQVNIPANPIKCCEFLYGQEWQTPMKKNSEYDITIENNKPKFIYFPIKNSHPVE